MKRLAYYFEVFPLDWTLSYWNYCFTCRIVEQRSAVKVKKIDEVVINERKDLCD